jgi:hypothetical protein
MDANGFNCVQRGWFIVFYVEKDCIGEMTWIEGLILGMGGWD